MVFIQVGGAPIIKLDSYSEGDVVIEGVYVGSYETQFGQPAFKFMEKNGSIRAVSCGTLKHKMQDVEKGTTCRIIYLGKQILSKGTYKGRSFHDVDLLIDDKSLEKNNEDVAEEEQF